LDGVVDQGGVKSTHAAKVDAARRAWKTIPRGARGMTKDMSITLGAKRRGVL
jgi:hypothetical protein